MYYKAKMFVTKAQQTVEGTMASSTNFLCLSLRLRFQSSLLLETNGNLSRWIRLYLPIFFETNVYHQDGIE